MSVASDLAGAFAELELTVPVTCGNTSTRAFRDLAGTVRKVGGGQFVVEVDTLYIERGALDPNLRQEVQITVGELGDASAVGGQLRRVTRIEPFEDGLLQVIALAGGAS